MTGVTRDRQYLECTLCVFIASRFRARLRLARFALGGAITAERPNT